MAPYAGMDPALVGKMDDCVDKVMAQGHDKSSAIAICRASIEKGDDCPGCPKPAKSRPKSKARAVRRENRRNATKAALLRSLADAIDDDEAAALDIDAALVEYDADEAPAVAAPVTVTGDKRGMQSAAMHGPGFGLDLATPVPARTVEPPGPTQGKDGDLDGYGEGDAGTAPYVDEPPAPVTLEALQAQRAIDAAREAEARLASDFVTVTTAIVASPAIQDKGEAVVEQAGVFKRLWQRIRQGMDALGAKVGARHSKQDQDDLQSVHDYAVRLGAMCAKAASEGSSFVVTKAQDGSPRWLGVVSNNFKDRDGEIITAAAHQEFCKYLDASPADAPQWFTWHTDVGHKSRADFWDYVDGFLMMSGPASEEDAARYAAYPEPLGMSHGFRGVKQGSDITQYRSTEVSDLPAQAAANPWTEFTVLEQEVKAMGFDPKKREFFAKLFGEERAAQIETEAAARAKELSEQGVQHKDAADTAPAAEADAQPAAAQETEPAPVEAQPVAEAVAEAAPEPPAPPAPDAVAELTAVVKALQEQMAAAAMLIQGQEGEIAGLKAGLDAAVATAIAPRVAPVTVGVRASVAKETAEAATAAQTAALKTVQNDFEWVQNIGPLTGGA